MTFNEFISFYTDIDRSISQNRLFDVIRRIKLLCDRMTEADLSSRISNVEHTYFYMLDYFIKGANDPSREDLLSKLKIELYSINDELLHRLVLDKQKYPLIDNVPEETIDLQFLAADENDIIKTFYAVAYRNKLIKSSELHILEEILFSPSASSYDKGLILSALFLASLRQYSVSAIRVLAHVYINLNVDIKLRIKALIYLYFISFKYSNRISIDKEIKDVISLVINTPGFSAQIALIILQHLRCRNSDSLNAKVEKEIIPEIMKFSPKLKGLNKKNISIDEMIEANPEWEKMMQDSELSSALKDISEFQFDGADIFLNTFRQLSHHIFFNKVHNWFAEYSGSNDSAFINLPGEIKGVLSGADMISDSDKFALSLSMSGLGTDMQQMMIQSFREQAEVWAQYKSDKDKNSNMETKLLVRNIMQDLYRFFKFVGLGRVIKNPFEYIPVIDDNILINNYALTTADIRACADYLLKYDNYSSAISYLNMIIDKGDITQDVYQKIGFCYQCMKDYQQAIEYYKKAEILSADSVWLLTHLAQTYKALGDFESALHYYKRIVEIQPNNIGAILNMGHMSLSQDKLNEALHYYYQADFVSGGTARTLRPIAWCEFLRGDYAKSEKYYNQIPDADKNSTDYLNMGHLYFVQSDYPKAENYYLQSLKKINGDINTFIANYHDDEDVLIERNVLQSDIFMMLDKVCFSYSDNKD